VCCNNHLTGTRTDGAGTRRIADEIDSRKQWQDRLCGTPNRSLEYTTVVENPPYARWLATTRIMRQQLRWLLDFAGYDDVTLRVVPEKASAQTGTDGVFAILAFPDPLEISTLFAHYPGGVVAEQEPRVVERAQQRLNAVLATALPTPDSMELIEQRADAPYPE
jgi:hypothetical protein